MRGKAISILIVLLIVSWLGWVFFFKDYLTTQTGGEYKNVTDLSSSYDAAAEVATALEYLRTRPESATIITSDASKQRQIALTFDGLTDRMVMQKILNLLEKYNVKATFFVDGMQTAEDPQTVVDIRKAGHKIENYTLMGLTKMETLSVERLITDFCRSQKIVKVTADQGPHLLKCNETNYTEMVLQAAKACGFQSVVKSDAFVTVKSMNSDQAATGFVEKLRQGSIVSVKLKPNIDPIVQEKAKIDLKPAWDKKPGLKTLPKDIDPSEKEIVIAIERLLVSLTQAKFNMVYVETFPANQSGAKRVSSSVPQTSLLLSAYDYGSLLAVRSFDILCEQLAGLFSYSKAYAAVDSEIQGNATNREIKLVYTTEHALAYTFSGLGNEVVVRDVLDRLNRMGSKATFFVTEVELRQHTKLIQRIIAEGHEIGLAIRPRDGLAVESIRQQIISGQRLLQSQYRIKTNLVKQAMGAVAENTRQAVADVGGVMIGQSITAVQVKHKDYSSVDQVMAELFPRSILALARGQIVHFRMDFYTSPQLLGDLIEAVKKQKIDNIAFSTFYDNPGNNASNDSSYEIKSVGAILNNQQYRYNYPVNLEDVPANLRRDGAAPDKDRRRTLDKIARHYIGNPDVNVEDRILNFSRMENRRIDKSGLIHTDDRVIFFTFDDWGTDASINKLLYVLRKHQVTATFFVITRSVLNNPNLLRAVAEEGHEIGSHSDMHKPMVYLDPKTGKQVSFKNNKEEYLLEMKNSFRKLRDVTGDVSVNGKSSLTRLYRPPQLAINKDGLEAVFEAGFEFVVSGSYSTKDYAAKDVTDLVNGFLKGIYNSRGELEKGSVMVMHMSDTAPYTAVALDVLLTANAAKADSDPTKFKTGRLTDYLTDGYSQKDRKKINRIDQTGSK